MIGCLRLPEVTLLLRLRYWAALLHFERHHVTSAILSFAIIE